ncbi:MAG: FKBP-type peptidyl-prolyl cis-trans isomerase [Rhodoferax sp.]|nr:FKBP-type peptidyl-prolyl cis-trans isomerase [Rhodoferax sp.]
MTEATMTSPVPTVQPGSFLTLHYRLGGPAGDIINTFNDKPATLCLGTGELSPAVEQCLIGLAEGSRKVFELPAGAAFGERKDDMQQWVARSLLDRLGDPAETYQVGDVVQFPTPDGQGSYAGAVVQVGHPDSPQALLVDFNHPLAGQPVVFEVHLVGVL